ncbi:MAG: diacylglycerol kinase family protein [Armatimonadota bacterium]
MRLLLVYNPNARLARLVPQEALVEELRGLGAEVELGLAYDTPEAVAITLDALRAGFNRVVAAGGDGTASAVIDALAGTAVPLGIIPLGTGNVLAAEAGLRPGQWREACRVAVGDELVRIDLGKAGDRYFATMFGVGIDAQTVVEIAARHKANYGRLAFVSQFFKTLLHSKPAHFNVLVDGEPRSFQAWSVIVSNTARYAWRLHLAPDARPDDGMLNLCCLTSPSRLRLILEGLSRFVLMSRGASPAIECCLMRRLTVDATPPVPWQADGELGGTTPVEIEVIPQALTVAVRDCNCSLKRRDR